MTCEARVSTGRFINSFRGFSTTFEVHLILQRWLMLIILQRIPASNLSWLWSFFEGSFATNIWLYSLEVSSLFCSPLDLWLEFHRWLMLSFLLLVKTSTSFKFFWSFIFPSQANMATSWRSLNKAFLLAFANLEISSSIPPKSSLFFLVNPCARTLFSS